jgi:phosphoglycolate phosphatase-like HAD superfamily hydrolase
MNKILCLDFDGVICNSFKECLLTSYIAYQRLINNIHFDKDVVIPEYIKEGFVQHRYLVRPAKEYGMLQHMLHNREIVNMEIFTEACQEYRFPMDDYEPLFFQVRAKLISSDLSYWLNMNNVYSHVLKYWTSITTQIPTYIVTNKNYNSVILLLDHFKLNFNKDNIFSKGIMGSKADTLITLAKHHNIKLEKVIFIDDNSQYISEMLDLGIKAYLADWGYERFNNKSYILKKEELIKEFGDISGIINQIN